MLRVCIKFVCLLGKYIILFRGETSISVANKVLIVATPEVQEATTNQPLSQPTIPTPPPPPPPPSPNIQSVSDSSLQQQNNQRVSSQPRKNNQQQYSQPLKKLTWSEFVETQVKKYRNPFTQTIIRFFMMTGFRNTPWVRKFAGYSSDSGIEYRILYDVFSICSISPSDDTLSYFSIRIYLLVENYGTNLFVSWIAWFEPTPSTNVCSVKLYLMEECKNGKSFVFDTRRNGWSYCWNCFTYVAKKNFRR